MASGNENLFKDMELSHKKYSNILKEHPFYKILLSSTNKNISKPRERNKVKVSPYELMCMCLLKKSQKYEKKIEIIKTCEEIIEKNTNIEYIIRKNFEVIFLKKYLLNQDQKNFFRYNFKSINLTKPETTRNFIEELDHEFNLEINKDMIYKASDNGNDHLLEEFADYHTN